MGAQVLEESARFQVCWIEIDGEVEQRRTFALDAEKHHGINNKTDWPLQVTFRLPGQIAVVIKLEPGQRCGFECARDGLEITVDYLRNPGPGH